MAVRHSAFGVRSSNFEIPFDTRQLNPSNFVILWVYPLMDYQGCGKGGVPKTGGP